MAPHKTLVFCILACFVSSLQGGVPLVCSLLAPNFLSNRVSQKLYRKTSSEVGGVRRLSQQCWSQKVDNNNNDGDDNDNENSVSVILISCHHSERNRLQTDYEMYTTASREYDQGESYLVSSSFYTSVVTLLNFKTYQSEILFCHSRRRCTTSHFCFSAVQIFSKTLEL